MEFNPTDELGAVNWYRFGRCTAADDPCQTPLQDEVNLGGDLMVFHVPGSMPAAAAGAAAPGMGGTTLAPLAAGSAALAAGIALALADLRRRGIVLRVRPARPQHA
jgi:hypothetical protein